MFLGELYRPADHRIFRLQIPSLRAMSLRRRAAGRGMFNHEK
jgi:hypothetical protein